MKPNTTPTTENMTHWKKAIDGYPVPGEPESLKGVICRSLLNKIPFLIYEINKEYYRSVSVNGNNIQYCIDDLSNIEYLVESPVVPETLNCPNCQGCGCPTCAGSGFIYNPVDTNPKKDNTLRHIYDAAINKTDKMPVDTAGSEVMSPELWVKEIFKKIAHLKHPEPILMRQYASYVLSQKIKLPEKRLFPNDDYTFRECESYNEAIDELKKINPHLFV